MPLFRRAAFKQSYIETPKTWEEYRLIKSHHFNHFLHKSHNRFPLVPLLDELPPWREDGIKETLHVLMSPWRANDIETTMKTIVTETDRNARKKLISDLRAQLKLRERAGIQSITYRLVTFYHT